MTKIFVYGTLKKGFGNHGFLRTAKFLGNAQLKAVMYSFGAFPVIAEEDGLVSGEVYEVDAKTFKGIDRLEGYPSFYDRKERTVLSDSGSMTAWVYFMPKNKISRLPIVHGGVWK